MGFYPKTKEYGEVITALCRSRVSRSTLTVMETAAWLERIYQREGQEPYGHMVDVGWSTGSPEPDLVLRSMFHSSAGPRGGLINGIADPEIDAALDQQQAEPDPEARRELIQTVATPKLAELVPSLSLFTSVLLHGPQRVARRALLLSQRARSTRDGRVQGLRTGLEQARGVRADLLRPAPDAGRGDRAARLIHDLRALRVVPGDPARIILGPHGDRCRGRADGARHGSARPDPVQYARYLGQVAQGDFGTSFIKARSGGFVGGGVTKARRARPRARSVAETCRYTLLLAGMALVFTAVIALPLGIAAG
jgi:hypothetical protein